MQDYDIQNSLMLSATTSDLMSAISSHLPSATASDWTSVTWTTDLGLHIV